MMLRLMNNMNYVMRIVFRVLGYSMLVVVVAYSIWLLPNAIRLLLEMDTADERWLPYLIFTILVGGGIIGGSVVLIYVSRIYLGMVRGRFRAKR